jgi:hypothetical protein
MRTLDHWKPRLSTVPSTIDCPEMQLLSASSHEAPIFVGPGHLDIISTTAISYTMFAQAADGTDAFRRLVQAQNNPYQSRDQFRLVATDYEGTLWECGWTRPQIKGVPKIGWPLAGNVRSLVTQAVGHSVSPQSGVELVFQPKVLVPMEKAMVSVTSVDGKKLSSGGVRDNTVSKFSIPRSHFSIRLRTIRCGSRRTRPTNSHIHMPKTG